jgi:hypothetical protein
MLFITQGAGIGLPITVTLPAFPNVPNLPGVPQIPRSLLYPPSLAPGLLTEAAQGTLYQATVAPTIWGVFDQSGTRAIDADSVADFGQRQEYRVSNYPVQRGAFASYNKVTMPFECSVVLTKGGSVTDRNNFLTQVDAVVSSINPYNILTAEKTYMNVTATRAELSRRGAANAAYFDVELFFIQIIEIEQNYGTTTGTPGTPSTADSSVASAVPSANQGVNYPQTPTTAVQTAVTAAITPPVPTG